MTGGGRFFEEFIDDYFSECDEHLETVRRTLLDLEETGGSAPDPARLHELSRALHTLKGLSGMVGLSAAEEVAHAMEECVRAIASTGFASPELTESLFAGEALLDSSIAAHRGGNAAPSPGPYVDRVRDVVAMAGDQLKASAAGESADVITVDPSGALSFGTDASVHRFAFTPSAELADRGIGVELMRQRLGTIGDIVATTPRVLATGGVVFEFGVAIHSGIAPDESWRADGLSWELIPSTLGDATKSVGVVVHSPKRGTTPLTPTASNVVRVDLARLDELMRMVGELVVTRARLGESVTQASSGLSSNTWDDLNEANEMLERQLRSIREGVMRIRLVPIGEVFERMRFAMRDIARETGKAIHLEFDGQTTEIDKLVVDRMLEPLLHLVRNAASHGIESRADRVAAGKAADGTIALRARAAGDRIVIEVEDDGAGIDSRQVARRAGELSLVPSDERSNEQLSLDALLDIICSPGFSTRDTADLASGRGVGMAVVRSAIRGLGGELFVDSVLGQGTRFTIELPLTLMITDALILEIGDQAMAIPQIALREIVPFDRGAVTQFENNAVLSYRGRVLPLVDLSVLFKFPSRPGAARHVLIVGSDHHLAGLVVDRILGLREIVVHPVTDPLITVPGVSGATELSDGRVGLILDAAALVRGTRDRHSRAAMRILSSPAPSMAPALTSPEHTWS